MTIHSFRRVLRVRRQVYAIPWSPGRALVLPFPVPLLGFAYFAGLEVAFLVVSRLPVVGALSRLPFWLWWVVPFWLTYLALTSSFDGRMPHLWLRSWVAFRLRPRRTRAGLAVADGGRLRGRVRWWVDEHAPELHRSRVAGPATVEFNVPVRVRTSVAPSIASAVVVARPARGAPDRQAHYVAGRMEVKP